MAGTEFRIFPRVHQGQIDRPVFRGKWVATEGVVAGYFWLHPNDFDAVISAKHAGYPPGQDILVDRYELTRLTGVRPEDI